MTTLEVRTEELDERRHLKTSANCHTYLKGTLKPSDESIIRRLQDEITMS